MTMSQRIGWRSYVSPLSSLLTSIYGVWNAETTTTTLATSVYSAWNGEGLITPTQLSASMSNAWQGVSSFPVANYAEITASMSNLWKAENNTTDSIGSLVGTSPSGSAPAFTTGKLGTYSFTFDGVNDYVALPTGSLKFTGDFSISMWVKATNWNNTRTLMSNADMNNVGNKWNGWWLDVSTNGKLQFMQINNGTWNTTLSSSVPLLIGKWSLITITRSATTSTMYINGSKVGSVTNTISLAYSTTNFPCIGVNRYLTGNFQEWFLGSLDEIGTWERALIDNEIIALYNSGIGQEYPYSNNTTVVLDSFGTSHGLMSASMSFSTGKIGNAFSFNGSSYVDLPLGSLNKTSDFSVSLWVYPTANNSTMDLISSHDGLRGWDIQYLSGNLWFWGSNGTGGSTPTIQVQTGHSIVLNTWTHVLVTVKSGVQVKAYINGSLTNTISITGKLITYDNYSPYFLPLLGAKRYQNAFNVLADQQNFFTGKLDGIGLWDRELTSSEASAIYNGGSGNEYPFSNASVSSPADSVSTNNGTIVGGVTYTPGVVGNAFTFNGSNYISLPTNSLNLSGDFSINLWWFVNITNDQALISNRQVVSGNQYGWQLYYNSGWMYFYIGNGTSTVTINADGVGYPVSTWVNITLVRKSGTSTKLYVNGLERTFTVSQGSATNNPAYTGNQQYCAIGNCWNGTYLDSYMKNGSKLDNVTVWTKALTDDEITQLYNMGGGIQYPFTTQTIRKPYSVYNGDDLVDPIGAKNATIVGGVTYSAGKIGNAYTFNGTTGYLTLPSTSLNFQGKSFSFSMWLKFNGTPANQSAILSNCFTNKGFHLGVIGDILYMSMGNGTGTAPQIQGPSVSEFTNKWGHVTFVWEHGVGMKFYLNGELFNSVANTTTIDFTSLTTLPNIGRKVDGGGWGLLNGSIDGLTFWDSAVTPPEVLTLFNEGNGMEYPYSSTLLAKLPSFTDSVATNHGTSPSGSAPAFSVGKIGKAFKFDGVNDYIQLPNNSLNSLTGDFSVSGWLYMPANTSSLYCVLLSNVSNDYTTGKGWSVFTYGNNIYFDVYYSGVYQVPNSAYVRLQANNTLTNNAWNHVTITRKNSTSSKIYINGSLVGSNTSIQNPATPTAAITPTIGVLSSVGVGNPLSSYAPNGSKVDALSVWNKELTAEEVTSLYNSGTGKQYPNY